MEDHDLDRSLTLLRELPREHARPGFTGRVLAGLDARNTEVGGAGRPVWRQPRMVVAAAALLVVTTSAGIVQVAQVRAGREANRAEARRVLKELRSEHDSLKQELKDLSAPPVLYVGGNDQVDLVVDLSRMRNAAY